MKPDNSQRRMIIKTRPVRELDTLKGEMGEATEETRPMDGLSRR